LHQPDAGALVKTERSEHSWKVGLNSEVMCTQIPAQVMLTLCSKKQREIRNIN